MAKKHMTEKDAILVSGILGFVILLLVSPLWAPMIWNAMVPQKEALVSGSAVAPEKEQKETEIPQEPLPVIDESGMTLGTRINPAKGYQRVEVEPESLGEFLRQYQLKGSTGVVKLWNGSKREQQETVQAVFKLPMEKEDLQRSAGAVLRVYTEYFWAQRAYDKISFQLINGFQADYKKWQEGFLIRTDATGSIWVNGGSVDNSEDNLKKYLHTVLTYTSVASMVKESKKIKHEEIQIGDIFLKTGSESDVVMIVDICENKQGKRGFLLAKGGRPAQQFHLLNNPAHKEDPWYYEEELQYPFKTSEGTFEKGSLRRLSYLK